MRTGVARPGSASDPEVLVESVQLFAADDHDLDALRHVLHELPPETYGQVLVESVSPEADDLERPAGVALTWLHRDPAAATPLPAGALAARAVGAWAAEWMPGLHDSLLPTIVWLGVSVRRDVTALLHGHDCAHHHDDAGDCWT